eukprot:12573495-Ditylum_brightwellii.AAC.1
MNFPTDQRVKRPEQRLQSRQGPPAEIIEQSIPCSQNNVVFDISLLHKETQNQVARNYNTNQNGKPRKADANGYDQHSAQNKQKMNRTQASNNNKKNVVDNKSSSQFSSPFGKGRNTIFANNPDD